MEKYSRGRGETPGATARLTETALTERRITDPFMGGIALLFVFISIVVGVQGAISGRISEGPLNLNSLICGIDLPVKDLPYVYYPLNPKVNIPTISISDGRCVKQCPSEKDVKEGRTIPVSRLDIQSSESGTSTIVLEFVLESPVYASVLQGHSYCIPVDPTLKHQIISSLSTNGYQLRSAVGGISQAWGSILFYSLLGWILGISVSFLIRPFANAVVLLGAVYLTVLSLGGGLFCMHYGTHPRQDDSAIMHSSNFSWSIFIGLVLLLLGLSLGFLYSTSRNWLKMSGRALECAHEALSDIPGIVVFPILQSIGAAVWASIWLFVFLKLAGILEYSSDPVHPLSLDPNGGPGITPLSRSAVFPVWAALYSGWWVMVFFVVNEFCLVLSHFGMSYTATIWYFSPSSDGTEEREVGWCPPLVSVPVGLLHHTGSFFLAAIVMSLTRFIRIFLGWNSYKGSRDSIGRYVDETIRMQMLPCRGIVDTFGLAGFTEMALSSSYFIPGMRTASHRLSQSSIGHLSGYSVMTGWTITGGISLTVGLLCLGGLKHTHSPHSSMFVGSPLLVAVVTSVITAYVICHFQCLWDSTAEALLYCYAVESIKPNGEIDDNPLTHLHAPPQLKEYICDIMMDD